MKIVKSLIKNGELEIKLKACSLLSIIIQYLTAKQQKEVISYAEELINDKQDDMNIAGINLNKLVINYKPPNEIQEYFQTKLVEKYHISSQGMKKQIIYYCSAIAKHVEQSFLNKEIIGCFIHQRLQQKSWSIRKCCVQILPSLVECSTTMKHHLSDVLLNLTADNNKIVKLAAFKIIPQFIAKYKDSDISDQLISVYASSTDHEINKQANTQDQILQKVVFYFPGVLATIGVSKWDKISSLFSKFLFYKNVEINLSICSSLHEICKLLGPQIAEDYIIKALNYFIFNQTCYELKLKALENIAQIIEVFEPQVRRNFIDIFMAIQQDSIMWRYKYAIAVQIQTFSKIYSCQDIYCYIFPIIFKLCSDSVSEVRQKAADNIHHLLLTIRKGKHLIQNAMQFINTLAKSKEYQQRMIFCRIFRHLYKIPQFMNEMKDFTLILSEDNIVSVRISLAVTFATILQEDGEQSLITFSEALLKLKRDEQTKQYFE